MQSWSQGGGTATKFKKMIFYCANTGYGATSDVENTSIKTVFHMQGILFLNIRLLFNQDSHSTLLIIWSLVPSPALLICVPTQNYFCSSSYTTCLSMSWYPVTLTDTISSNISHDELLLFHFWKKQYLQGHYSMEQLCSFLVHFLLITLIW